MDATNTLQRMFITKTKDLTKLLPLTRLNFSNIFVLNLVFLRLSFDYP